MNCPGEMRVRNIFVLRWVPWRVLLRNMINSLFSTAILPINPQLEGRVGSDSVNRDQVVQQALTLPFPAPGMPKL